MSEKHTGSSRAANLQINITLSESSCEETTQNEQSQSFWIYELTFSWETEQKLWASVKDVGPEGKSSTDCSLSISSSSSFSMLPVDWMSGASISSPLSFFPLKRSLILSCVQVRSLKSSTRTTFLIFLTDCFGAVGGSCDGSVSSNDFFLWAVRNLDYPSLIEQTSPCQRQPAMTSDWNKTCKDSPLAPFRQPLAPYLALSLGRRSLLTLHSLLLCRDLLWCSGKASLCKCKLQVEKGRSRSLGLRHCGNARSTNSTKDYMAIHVWSTMRIVLAALGLLCNFSFFFCLVWLFAFGFAAGFAFPFTALAMVVLHRSVVRLPALTLPSSTYNLFKSKSCR